MKNLFLVALFTLSGSAFAGFSSYYKGYAECGAAEAFPRENSYYVRGDQCSVTLRLAPDGRDPYGRITGDCDWTVGDMRFSCAYIQIGSQLYLDFHGKRYSAYRGATLLRRGVSVQVGRRNVLLTP